MAGENIVTLGYKRRGIQMARCQLCDHDLIVRKGSLRTGAVYCSNLKCSRSDRAHPTGSNPNAGKGMSS